MGFCPGGGTLPGTTPAPLGVKSVMGPGERFRRIGPSGTFSPDG